MINRRGFFAVMVGALVLDPVTKMTPVKFPPEKILEIDEEGIVHPWQPGTMLSYDPKTRTILRVKEPFPPL